MQAIILKSNPDARFRFGEALGAFTEDTHNAQKTTSPYPHSDTLWSALVNAWALCCPETVEDFIVECKGGKFKLSSASYCVEQNDKSVYFLPKPVSLNLFQFDEPQKLKQIKFISKGIWENGLLPEDWFNPDRCTLLQNESIVALKSEIDAPAKLFAIETTPRTQVRDITRERGNMYFQTDLYLAKNVNWYFLLENNLSENLQNDFQTAMKTVVNLGIGGERTTGNGSLSEFAESSWDFSVSETSNYTCSLSLIAPNESELTDNSLYQVIKRGGRFLENGNCLPMIQMLLEGAVFDTEPAGKIVTLNEKPPVLRYGINLSIPLHNNFINKEL